MAFSKRPTFLKRQKEQQRLARAAQKREQRLARRRANTLGTPDPEAQDPDRPDDLQPEDEASGESAPADDTGN